MDTYLISVKLEQVNAHISDTNNRDVNCTKMLIKSGGFSICAKGQRTGKHIDFAKACIRIVVEYCFAKKEAKSSPRIGLGFLLRKNKEDKSMQEFKPVKEGKVREVYDNGDSMIIVATDRISAFDHILKNIRSQKKVRF